jgi:chromosomal replication initiation ATPase DnaA
LRCSWNRIHPEIISLISKALKIPEEKVTEKGPYRNISVYLTKKSTGFTNKEIGEYFGGVTYSAVTRRCERLEHKMRTDVALRRKVEKLMAITSPVKG